MLGQGSENLYVPCQISFWSGADVGGLVCVCVRHSDRKDGFVVMFSFVLNGAAVN